MPRTVPQRNRTYKKFMLVSNDALEQPMTQPMNIHEMAAYLGRSEKGIRWSALDSVRERNARNRKREIKKHKPYFIISFWDNEEDDDEQEQM